MGLAGRVKTGSDARWIALLGCSDKNIAVNIHSVQISSFESIRSNGDYCYVVFTDLCETLSSLARLNGISCPVMHAEDLASAHVKGHVAVRHHCISLQY